jgi:hypothetical protein
VKSQAYQNRASKQKVNDLILGPSH